MARRVVRSRRTLTEVRRIVRDLPEILAGRKNDVLGVRRAFWSGFAFSLFGDIWVAFQEKSDLRSDDLGDSWEDIKDSTKAARLSRMAKSPKKSSAYRKAGKYLSPSQRKKVRQRKRVNLLAAVKGKHFPVLDDRGLLLKSLSQGKFNGVNYVPPTPRQIFQIKRDRLILGTRDPKASAHHRGVPSRNLPQRRLWPENMDTWYERASRAGNKAVLDQMARSI